MNAAIHALPGCGHGLDDALARLNARLARLAGVAAPDPADGGEAPAWRLDDLARRLALSAFEREVVLLAAAAELVGSTRALIERLGGSAPSLALAMRVCDGAEWQALRPDGALRRARVIGLGDDARTTERPIHLEEPVLCFLHGICQLDPRVVEVALPAHDRPSRGNLPAGIASLFAAGPSGRLPLVELIGPDPLEGVARAVAALAAAGFGAVALPLARLPREAAALAALRGAWLRDSLLHDLGLILVAGETGGSELASIVAGWMGPVIVVADHPVEAALTASIRVPAEADTFAGRRQLWRDALGEAAATRHNETLDRLATSFSLPPARIAALAEAHRAAPPASLWAAAREAARPAGDPLLEPIEPRATLDDLILPASTHETLEAIVSAVATREQVLSDWGFALRSARGLGIAALFVGESGTGKTMAAEAIAHALGVDLCRVEVSAVVSKYLGETEKHLRRVFHAAEQSGCVLLFDEADTLFGKRSEVRDAHDRYANMEIGYLLQLMESYRGLAVLTTNIGDALDAAFLRRLCFVVRFPLPGHAERLRMWERAFPAATPTQHLNFPKLAKLALSGGIIRNVALGAAFRAAAGRQPVGMTHVLAAARAEFVKYDRPLAEIDARDWT